MKSHICFLLVLSVLCTLSPSHAESIWLEAEIPTSFPEGASDGWANPSKLSGSKVLALNIGKNEMEKMIPNDGVILSYPFRTQEAGPKVLWNRVVFEGIRGPFQWRVDSGEWITNSQEAQPIVMVQELAFWNPIGWTRMGEVNLTAGTHQLEIKIDRHYDDNNQPTDVRYISDALLIAPPGLLPHFQFAPGSDIPGTSDSTHSFILADTGAPRETLLLSGTWELAPYEELSPITNAQRVSGAENYPDVEGLTWYAYTVPGGRNQQFPDLRYVHRYVVRSSVEIPKTFNGASFQLTFEMLNLINTLFINGQKVGDFDIVEGQWQVDATPYLKAGQKNEILLVIKDTYYAMELEQEPISPQKYYPDRLFQNNQGVTNRFDYPAANGHSETGILDVARLEVSRGPVMVTDTFVKPFPITKGVIEFETTVISHAKNPVQAGISQSIRTWPEGEIVGSPITNEITLNGEDTLKISLPSDPYTLWWTYDPALYELVTDLVVNGKVIDRQITRFGNREWEIRGNQFFLNGVQQHLRADLTHYSGGSGGKQGAEKAMKELEEIGVNMFRRRFQDNWFGMKPRETLAFMDEQGMPVRQNAATFDGQVASYKLVEGSGTERTARKDLFERWRAQILNGVNARKNNPSIFIWELDNELVYINARNFGLLDQVEPEFTKTSDAVMAFDPTRATVIGGGAALSDESLPTYGIHYFEVDDRKYPAEAYTAEKSLQMEGSGEKGRVWPVNFEKKPIFLSETAFLSGRNGAGFAAVGGEVTFLGKRQARPAAGKIASWLAEGYRWKGLGAVHFWFNKGFTDGSYTYAWQPVALLRNQWGNTFGSGEAVSRSLRLYNDLPDQRPLTAKWSLELNGESAERESKTFNVAPGTFEPWDITFNIPKVSERSPGILRLTVNRDGEEVFNHGIDIEIVPEPTTDTAKIDGPLLVWDPEGSTLALAEVQEAEPVEAEF